ncbi:endocuticle structural glycoprotein SgAbd-1-like [Musca domestica]|uniref:Endocuticle structural glycoprotein SgAbd-1-like n=1 Tax=Musca domestica TaxID=7370 RepID=A0ABM3USZ0_MUSDO|nr:endocuticle structural glycoprotein SgAbd-1-like [Musca domestica]
MRFFVAFLSFAAVCIIVSARLLDNHGQYYHGQYYDGRYYKNRDFYNQRRYYDNLLKPYRADVVARESRIVEQKVEPAVDGNFAYQFDTENGIHAEARGTSVNIGAEEPAQKIEGSFAYITPEGLRVGVRYVADEAGYRPVYTFDGFEAVQHANSQPAANVEITKIH